LIRHRGPVDTGPCGGPAWGQALPGAAEAVAALDAAAACCSARHTRQAPCAGATLRRSASGRSGLDGQYEALGEAGARTGRRAAAASQRSRRGRSRRPTCRWPVYAGTGANCDRSVGTAPVGSWRLRIRRMVEAPTRWPSLSSSPWIRRWPPARVLRRHLRDQRGRCWRRSAAAGPIRVGPAPRTRWRCQPPE
jgi:hypothetical protein